LFDVDIITSTASFSPLLRTRYFFPIGSGHITDPHQSPIGIKAIVVFEVALQTHCPCPLFGPRKSSVPCRVQ